LSPGGIQGEKEDMVRKRVLKAAAVLTVVTGLLASGCGEVSEGVRTESEVVELGGAESARVEINMGAGVLRIAGGAEDLLEANFTYSQESWKPEVNYAVSGSEGVLTISQPSVTGVIPSPELRYEWGLRFNNDVPMDMKIEMGVGGGELELGDLNLRKLDLSVGVGGANISLDGDWEADLDATISGGVGGLNLTLPRDVGVRVEADSGLGGVDARDFQREGDVYTNDAYGRTDVTLNIRVEVGVGGVELNLAD
jgi:hypothetical protein